MALDLTKPSASAATMAEALSDIRANMAGLASFNWTPYSVTAAATCGTTTETDGCLWKITGHTTVSTFNMPGKLVFAFVQDGFYIDYGGNVKNAGFYAYGNSFLWLAKNGTDVFAYPIGHHLEEDFWRRFHWQLNTGATTVTTDGNNQGITTAGTLTNQSQSDGEWLRATSIAGGTAKVNSATTFDLQRPISLSLRFKTQGSLTNVRLWAGLFTADPVSTDAALNSQSGAGIRFSTGASDTYWTLINNDGSASARVVASTLAPAINTVYDLKIEHDPRPSGGIIRFYINGRFLGSSVGSAEKVKVTTANVSWHVTGADLASATMFIQWNRTRVLHA